MRTYAVITPVRDEAENLPRLAASLAAQTLPPREWLVVDNGSSDGTPELARSLATEYIWVRVLSVPGAEVAERGAPVVRALHAAIDELATDPPEVVVNVDADISVESDYFERLLAEFDEDASLGIASGSGFELEEGVWRQRHVTGSTVWGASRAFRWECLQDVLPFEERVAWDGIDEFRANARGWRTHAFEELPFGITAARASVTGRRGRRAGIKDTRPTTSATARGTSSCGRSGTRAASPPRSG